MTSFRDSAATRAVILPSASPSVTYWMTRKVPGAIDPGGTFHDEADAYSTSYSDSVFSNSGVWAPGNGKKAVLHRINIVQTVTEVAIELPTESTTSVLLLDELVGTAGRNYDFAPGILLPDGFRVKISHSGATGRVLVVYSLLEN